MNEVKEKLFKKGIALYNKKEFYEAHEYWEELWIEYHLKDKKFIQALIQLTVAYYHLSTGNQKGALSLLNKSLDKMKLFIPVNRGFDVGQIVNSIDSSICMLEEGTDFDWSVVPVLKVVEL